MNICYADGKILFRTVRSAVDYTSLVFVLEVTCVNYNVQTLFLPLSNRRDNLQVFLNYVNNGDRMFEMRFALPRCNLPNDWIGPELIYFLKTS